VNIARNVAKNTLALTGGQIISKGLMVVYAGALGRYLSSTGLGQINTAATLCAVVFVLNLGLDTLVVRDVARARDQSGMYLWNSVVIKLVMGMLAVGVLYVVGRVGPYSIVTRRIIMLYAINSLLTALLGIANALFQACEVMEYVAGLQSVRDAFNVGLSLLAIAMQASVLVIVGISLLATALQLAAAFMIAKWLMPLHGFVNLTQIRYLLATSLPFAALAVATTAYSQMSGLLLPVMRSEQEMGYYSVALYVFTIVQLVPGMFSQSIFPVFSQMSSTAEKLKLVYEKSFRLLTIVGVYISIQTVLMAGFVVQLVFGQGFEPAFLPLQILGAMLALSGSYASGALLTAAGKQKLFVITYIVFVALQLGLGALLIPRWGAIGASMAYLVMTIAGSFYYASVCHRFLRLRPNWGAGFKILLAGIGTAILCYGALAFRIHVVVVAIFATFAYGAVVVGLRVLSHEEVEQIIDVFRYWTGRLHHKLAAAR